MDLTESLKRYGGAMFSIMRKYRDMPFESEPILFDTPTIEFYNKNNVIFSCECPIYDLWDRYAIIKTLFDWNEHEFSLNNRDVLFVNGSWRKRVKDVTIKITPHLFFYERDGYVSIKIPNLKIEDLI